MNAVFSNGGAEDNPNLPVQHDAGSNDPGSGNIDKIRDILFGSNMRDYEQRFARLEEALKKESSDLRETTRRHLETLESFVHKELAALEARLNTERDERSADFGLHSQKDRRSGKSRIAGPARNPQRSSPAIQGADRRNPRQGRGTHRAARAPRARAAARQNRSRGAGRPVQ